MRRIFSTLTSLLAASTVVQGRMGGNTSSNASGTNNGYSKDMSASVDFQTFDLDGQVHDLMWCGYSDEVVLLHTNEGTIYRSRDRGLSWKRMHTIMQKTATKVMDEPDQDVSSNIISRQILIFDFVISDRLAKSTR